MRAEFLWEVFTDTGAPEAYLLYRRNEAQDGTKADGARPADDRI